MKHKIYIRPRAPQIDATGEEATTVGQYLVDRLSQIGLKHLFSIPGDYTVEWVDRYVVPSKKIRAMGVQALQARADAKAADLAPIIEELQATGKTSLRAIAAGLNDAGIPTARGGKWSSPQVMRMLERLDPFREEEAAAA